MARMGRPGLSPGQKAELWERWKRGESLSDIGRALDMHAASIFGVLRTSGGIYHPPRQRSRRTLTLSEREEISRGVAANRAIRAIAMELGRAPSTASREVTRNGGRSQYRAAEAENAAWDKTRRIRGEAAVLGIREQHAGRDLADVVCRQDKNSGKHCLPVIPALKLSLVKPQCISRVL